jgi:hypothetical protein
LRSFEGLEEILAFKVSTPAALGYGTNSTSFRIYRSARTGDCKDSLNAWWHDAHDAFGLRAGCCFMLCMDQAAFPFRIIQDSTERICHLAERECNSFLVASKGDLWRKDEGGTSILSSKI